MAARKRANRRPVYTIGHSTRSAAELIAILRAFGVVHLVDIRTIPRSRTNPQFNSEALRVTLRRAKIGYTHLPALGGLRPKSRLVDPSLNAGWERPPFHNFADYAEKAEFRAGLSALLELAERETCAVMCAEAVWWRCHRRIIADHLLAGGSPVAHIMGKGKIDAAKLTPGAVIGGDGRLVYPPEQGDMGL
jgi:uncharacterized protein (DUF488 family)